MDVFINTQLWGRGKSGRKQLQKRLERRWKQVMPWRRELQMEAGMVVSSVCCNDLMAVFLVNQYGEQYWRLYNLVDLSLEYEVQTTNILLWSTRTGDVRQVTPIPTFHGLLSQFVSPNCCLSAVFLGIGNVSSIQISCSMQVWNNDSLLSVLQLQ